MYVFKPRLKSAFYLLLGADTAKTYAYYSNLAERKSLLIDIIDFSLI
jgi:hypothetical protein